MGRSDFVAIFAVLISILIPIGLELYRRARPLSMRIIESELVDINESSAYYCLKISVYNTASIPKTIFSLLCQDSNSFKMKEVRFSAVLQQDIAIFQPRIDGHSKRLKLKDIITLPMDIDPLHSKSFYVGVEVSPNKPLKRGCSARQLRTSFYFEAQDIGGKRAARTNWKCNYPAPE